MLFKSILLASSIFISSTFANVDDKHIALALASKESVIRLFKELQTETQTQFERQHSFIVSTVDSLLKAASEIKDKKHRTSLIKKASYYLKLWESRIKMLKHAGTDIKADEAKVALLTTDGLSGDEKIFADSILSTIKASLAEINTTTDSSLRGALIKQLGHDIKELESFLKKAHKNHPVKETTTVAEKSNNVEAPHQKEIIVK